MSGGGGGVGRVVVVAVSHIQRAVVVLVTNPKKLNGTLHGGWPILLVVC